MPQDASHSLLKDAVVELTAPDGRTFCFRFCTIIPYAEQDYVVLMETEEQEDGQEQVLITRLHESPEGELSFEVVVEADIVDAVFEKYTLQAVKEALEASEKTDDCKCGHPYDHGCDCGCHSK